MAAHTHHYALVVGVDHYPGYRDLRGAVRDADEVARWLTEEGGGSLPGANCKAVRSTPSPTRPIQDDVDEAMAELLEAATADDAPGGRRFYLYFSGHGLAREKGGVDLCLAKWSERRRNLALDAESYRTTIVESGLFAEVVALFDCCRIRKVNTRGLVCSYAYPRPQKGAAAARTFVAYATDYLNLAYEAETAGPAPLDPDGADVRGHFTRALLAALRGGATGRPGAVPASALKAYLERETPRIAREHEHEQRPEVVTSFPSDPEPVFGRPARPSGDVGGEPGPVTVALQVTFGAGRGGHPVVLEGPDLAVVHRGSADAAWDLDGLAPGLYNLRDERTGDEVAVRLRPGAGAVPVTF